MARGALAAAFWVAGASAFAGAADEAPRVPAIKLYDTPDHKAAFVRGTVPALHKIQSQQFWLSQSVEASRSQGFFDGKQLKLGWHSWLDERAGPE